MNMPPLPYLKRIPGLSADALHNCFTDASVWANFDPALMTLCSPDPQALPSAGGKDQRAAGHAADQLQGGALRLRQAHRDPAADADRDRGDPLRYRRRHDRIAGEAEGARLDLRAAGQVGDADHRQLSLRDEGRCGFHQRCGAPAIWMRRARCTTGCASCASRWVRRRTIWCRSRNTPRPRARWCVRPRPPARCSPARRISSGWTMLVQSIAAQQGMRNPVLDETVGAGE